MKKSDTIAELAKALSAFQGEVKQPFKDKNNPFFKSKYVPLESVVEAISETAVKHGLSFTQLPLSQDNRVGVITIMFHNSGEWIESEPIFAQPAKTDAQATGSVITYLKRYSLAAMFGITSDEDDDGEKGMDRSNQEPQKQYQQNRQQDYRQAPSEQYQSEPSNQNSNGISPSQLKAIKAKAYNIAKYNGVESATVCSSAVKHLGLPEGISSKDLTKDQARKLITYLATLEPVEV